MQFVFSAGKRQKKRSRAARQAVSPLRARRWRQAQTRRRLAATLRSARAFILRRGRAGSGLDWRRTRQASPRPAPTGANDTLLPGFSGVTPSKTVSLLLLAAAVAAIYWMHASERFFIYRENVHFEGTNYLTHEELFAACNVDNWSIFWLSPKKIENQVRAHPYVVDADVQIQWPAQVNIQIQEVRPVAVWATDQQEYWLLEDGLALPSRRLGKQPALRIIDPSAAARIANIAGDMQIDQRVLTSAMFLSNRLSIGSEFWYNSRYGLNFSLPSTQAWVHWGDGRQFEEKWIAMQRLMPNLEYTQDEALTLNVMAPNRSFIRRYDEEAADQ